ncbi:hypothetical protein BS47DRAFT_1359450 [Hydnum rufescens UP504]|uniref:Uncharacterized protein n=1 Tax=Hydnum rufescens UP504 TaxID=1448309 RepID=A0A9P6B4P9_9AGAM|nr:hypothetical protein BS47DRAFT_1359450 [Hydnum rufescens UP504]
MTRPGAPGAYQAVHVLQPLAQILLGQIKPQIKIDLRAVIVAKSALRVEGHIISLWPNHVPPRKIFLNLPGKNHPLPFPLIPPIPVKSPNVLQRLRASASAPNLFTQAASFSRHSKLPPKLDSVPKFHPPVHEHPLSLSPESTILAVVDPRPRFVASITGANDIPQSPYTLGRPSFTTYDYELGALPKCFPPYSKTKDTLTVPDLPKTGDLLMQFMQDDALLAAERAKWASRAQNSFGNKRSRSLSTRSMHHQIRRSRSANAMSGTASHEAEEGLIVDVGTTYTHSSTAPSHQTSLKYIAATAFGHGHSPKVSIDNSGVTSLGTWSTGTIPPIGVTSQPYHSHTSHSRTSSESKRKSGHKQKDSGRGVFEAVIGCVSSGACETSPERTQTREESPPVLDVKPTPPSPQISEAALAVEQRIGIALSTPPTTLEVTAIFPDYRDNVSKHRLPPQVHAHKRSLSAGSAPTALVSKQSSPSAKPYFSSSTPPRKESSASSHPFVEAAIKDSRPASGLLQAYFEDAVIASTSVTTRFGRPNSGGPISHLERLAIIEPNSPIPQDIGDDPESPTPKTLGEPHPEVSERRSPTPRPLSRLGLYLSPADNNVPPGPRPKRWERSNRRSLSLSDFSSALRESEQAPLHKRSVSEHVDRHDALTPPRNDVDSSLASSPQPDVLIGELDDLESFRDLFYRPERSNSEVHRSATASAFWGVVSPTLVGDGINWSESVDPSSSVHDLPQDEAASPSRNPSEGPLTAGPHNGPLHLYQIDTSLPSIRGSQHRHSSTPVIEHSETLEAEIMEATHVEYSSNPPSATDVSDSDIGVRLSQFTNASTERMSNIILDFPTPPEITASPVVLESYFPS